MLSDGGKDLNNHNNSYDGTQSSINIHCCRVENHLLMRFYFFLNSGCEATGVFSPATQGGVQSHSQPGSASEDCVNVQSLLFYWTKKKRWVDNPAY